MSAPLKRRRLIAVVGPPASGKTTVTEGLSRELHASVFRVREFAQRYRRRHTLDETLFDTSDELGWFGDEAVEVLLRARFLDVELGAVTLLENFPGSRTQLRQIVGIASALSASLTIVELCAADFLVTQRAAARRVCATCEPDPAGDPHRPAPVAANAPRWCLRCGDETTARRSDARHILRTRLRRYYSCIGAIRREAMALNLRYHRVDAHQPPHECLRHIVKLITPSIALEGELT